MKRYTNLLLAPVLALGLIGCSDQADPAAEGSDPPSTAENAEYPLDVCVVSGEKLGSMGDPIVITIDDNTFKLCCASCEPKLRADPEKYIKVLEQGPAGQTHKRPGEHGDGDHSGHDH